MVVGNIQPPMTIHAIRNINGKRVHKRVFVSAWDLFAKENPRLDIGKFKATPVRETDGCVVPNVYT